MGKKFLRGILMVFVVQGIMTSHVMAADNLLLSDSFTEERIAVGNANIIEPRVDQIVVKYRYYNGKRQYRRWNATKNCWVDPYWITIG